MMTKRTPEKQHSNNGTIELLLTSLEQAIEAKKQNVEAIANIRETLAGRIEEMQQALKTADGRLQTAAESAATPPVFSVACRLPSVVSKLPSFLWQWVIPAVIMFVFLWVVMWALQSNTEKGNREMPRLIETVNASNSVGSSSVGSVGAAYVPLDRTQENWDEAEAEETADDSFQIADKEEESCSEAVDAATADSPPSVVSSDNDASTVSNSRQMRRPFLRNLFTP